MRSNLKNTKPFISLSIIIATLFLVAFIKISLRRVSYSLHKQSKIFAEVQDEYYKNLREYSKIDQSERLEELARRNFLNKTKKKQIIQVIDGKAAISF